MRRRGSMLVEMIVVFTILAAISMPLAMLFRTLLADVPRNFRTYNTNITVQAIVNRLRADIDKAKSLPQSHGELTTDENTLLMDLPEGLIAYQLRPDSERIFRYPADTDPNSPDYYERVWSIPRAKIQWRVWRKDGRAYALEVGTCIEPQLAGGARKVLKNSHVFFLLKDVTAKSPKT